MGFVALGCPKNIVDSEKMLAHLVEHDFLISAHPDFADVVIINTCGFIAPAKAEAIDAIENAVKHKKKGNIRKVIVTGCLSERMGEDLLKEVEGIDAIVGLGQRDDIAAIINEITASNQKKSFLQPCRSRIHDDRTRLLITPPHIAYLRISEGCDHRCSFCTIPSIRGKFRSKPMPNILEEAAELASAGVKELNIIAQDTAYYGKDLGIKHGLPNLLTKLCNIDQFKWIRLMYLYPIGVTDTLLQTVAANEKIIPYFDIPIQHVSEQILKDMRRPESKQLLADLVTKLRDTFDDPVIRTTIIVGFPGETDQQFAELLDFIQWAEFDALGCFPYYAEYGTAAAELPNQVPDEIKQQRVDELMLAQQQIAFEKNKNRIGRTLECVIDEKTGKKQAIGRYFGQAYEIDSICQIEKCRANTGRFTRCKITGSKNYDLIAEQI